MESIIVQELAGNAPMMMLLGYIAHKLDKRLTILETIMKNDKVKMSN